MSAAVDLLCSFPPLLFVKSILAFPERVSSGTQPSSASFIVNLSANTFARLP